VVCITEDPLTFPASNLLGTLFAAASALAGLVPAQSNDSAMSFAPAPIIAPTLAPVPGRVVVDQPLIPAPNLAASAVQDPAAAEAAPPVEAIAPQLPAPRNAEEAFIFSLVPGAQASQRATGVPASVTIAQAILESFWGRSFLAREANNLFGVKALTKPGPAGVVTIDAWEVENGVDVNRPEPFRKYNTVAESIADHGLFFVENRRYREALLVGNDPQEFARRIAAAGYATDPAYPGKLISLMERYSLYQYDV
jgi:flagellum-specific peptidoglycan hydrolase FlgJ